MGRSDRIPILTQRVEDTLGSRGPFLERPGNLPGPESDFDIKVSRKVGCVLTSDEVHFVSLADNFTVQLSNFLKFPLEWKTKQLNRPGNYRELRETGPRAEKGRAVLVQCVMRRRTGTSAPSALPVRLMAAKNFLLTNRK